MQKQNQWFLAPSLCWLGTHQTEKGSFLHFSPPPVIQRNDSDEESFYLLPENIF